LVGNKEGQGAALLQLGNEEKVFLIDLVKLNCSNVLDKTLSEVFSSKHVKVVAMDFRNDVKEIILR
jgi:hypothetical protein